MSYLKTFTQGGQITLHNIRMFKQVARITILSCLLMALAVASFKTLLETNRFQWYYLEMYGLAQFKSISQGTKELWSIKLPNGQVVLTTPSQYLRTPYFHAHVNALKNKVYQNALSGFYLFIFLLLTTSSFWLWQGSVRKKKEILKGSLLVSPSILNKAIVKKEGFSQITLANVRLPKDFEVKHTLISGTTGAGKTTCFHDLLPQLRAFDQKAVIIDTTGEFTTRYYRCGKDVLLNPFDERSENWSLWKDCTLPYHFDNFAESLIPETKCDPFWPKSSRTLFSVTAQILQQDDRCYSNLVGYLLSASLSSLSNLLKHTEAASLVDPHSDKTAHSIRSHLSSYLKVFKYLKEEGTFSFKEWLSHSKGWLFIFCTPEQRETLRPLITAWFGLLTSSLMSLGPDPKRRIWFILDELASLHRLEALPQALAESRKYGGCMVAGFQDMSQLQDLYQVTGARTMMSLFNTKITFRLGDVETARTFTHYYGEQEVKEQHEGVSYGAHEMRDGVSIHEQRKTQPILSTTDFMSLDNLEAYLKLPGPYPLAKLRFKYPSSSWSSTSFAQEELV